MEKDGRVMGMLAAMKYENLVQLVNYEDLKLISISSNASRFQCIRVGFMRVHLLRLMLTYCDYIMTAAFSLIRGNDLAGGEVIS